MARETFGYGAIVTMLYMIGGLYFLIGPLRFPYQYGSHESEWEDRYNSDLKAWRKYIGAKY